LKQRERVRRGAREAGEDLAALQRPHLVGGGLHHRVAERDLAVAAQGDVPVAADAENRCAVRAHHACSPLPAPRSFKPSDGPGGTPASSAPPTYEYTLAWCCAKRGPRAPAPPAGRPRRRVRASRRSAART